MSDGCVVFTGGVREDGAACADATGDAKCDTRRHRAPAVDSPRLAPQFKTLLLLFFIVLNLRQEKRRIDIPKSVIGVL